MLRLGIRRLIRAGLASTAVACALFLPIGLDSSYAAAMLPTMVFAGLGWSDGRARGQGGSCRSEGGSRDRLAGGELSLPPQHGAADVRARGVSAPGSLDR